MGQPPSFALCAMPIYATTAYYELHATLCAAITREKQMKKWRRAWQLRLIEEKNPEWRDLFPEFAEHTDRLQDCILPSRG